MKLHTVFATLGLVAVLYMGALLGTSAAYADAPKPDPEKVKELIEKIRAHRDAKAERREKERKEREERRGRDRGH